MADPVLSKEPVFVFGARVSGPHRESSAAAAQRFHAAEPTVAEGRTGNAYAIPHRGADGKMLTPSMLSNHVQAFRRYAAGNGSTAFQIVRFGCEPDGLGDGRMSEMFRALPRNCFLPGVWQRLLAPETPVRVLVFDPEGLLRAVAGQVSLYQYLMARRAEWRTEEFELVSVGGGFGVAATAAVARKLKARHRILGENPAYYGAQSAVAAEMKAVWFSTHLLSVANPDRTADNSHVRMLSFAARDGLKCEDLRLTDNTEST